MPTSTKTPLASQTTARVGRRMGARDLALVAAFAALIAVFGIVGPIPLAGNSVPITLQSLGVMLAGAVLGWRRGAAAVAVLLLVGLAVPVLPAGRTVLAALPGASAGYLIGWVAGAAVIGALVQLRLPRVPTWWIALSAVVGGIFVIYLFGIPVQALRTGVDIPKAIGMSLQYLPGDLIKVAVCTAVAAAVHRAVPGLTAPLRARRTLP